MKKLLLVLAVAAFVACNDSGNTEETPGTDTPAAAPAPVPAPTPDTTATGDTTKVDTTSLKK